MHEDATCDAVAVNACEGAAAFFGIEEYSDYHKDVDADDGCTAYEAPFFADGAEDEVGALFGDEAVGGLRAVEVAFAGEPTGADSNH